MKRNTFLTRFLSDFTLGFSDGLSVPFALTAGLSSLGRTDTVIYGGLAELCAGSISMGIGGYLAACDENPEPRSAGKRGSQDEEEERRMLSSDWESESGASLEVTEKAARDPEDDVRLIQNHLQLLNLPHDTVSNVLETLHQQPNGVEQAATRLQTYHGATEETVEVSVKTSPIVSGLAISLGYTIGGIIPLLPYFFTTTVGTGLLWSTTFCLLALFIFGSGKAWVLHGETRRWRCIWDGLHMLILGTLAAGAAVACVKLLGGATDGKDR